MASSPPRELVWEGVSQRGRASWYLDPLVARQKRRLNAGLVQNLSPSFRRALKTDAFEEAFGEDSPLPDLLAYAQTWLVMDIAPSIVGRARLRQNTKGVHFLAADARTLPLGSASVDLIFSNSSLDHFRTRKEFEAAIHEVARVLQPGGTLVLSLDNPWNPGYWLLLGICKTRFAPFPLGYAPGPRRLREVLEEAGFDVTATGLLIHNPRGASTALFLSLRWLLGKKADRPIGGLLALFEWIGTLPTKRLTACFLTAQAVRRAD